MRPFFSVNFMGVKNSPLAGYTLAVISAVTFSAKGIFAKMLYAYGVDPVSLLALRFIIALPLFWLMVYAFPSARPSRRDTLILILSGLFGLYAAALADFYGLIYIAATLERIILYTYPAMVVVLSAFFFKQRIGGKAWLAICVIYAGLAVALKIWSAEFEANLIGAGLILASAVIYSASYIITESLGTRVSGVRMSAYTVSAATGAFVGTWVLKGAQTPSEPGAWIILLLLAIVSTFIPVLTLTLGIKMIGAGRAAIAAFAGPVSTAVLAWFILGETLDAMQISGMAVVLVGIIAVSWLRTGEGVVAVNREP